jgi:hypothetical protein
LELLVLQVLSMLQEAAEEEQNNPILVVEMVDMVEEEMLQEQVLENLV